jgi:2-amino-4-hydroxy-6-hydroxymethyldihydropteridine diphosphokinase
VTDSSGRARVAVALGANLGDRAGAIRRAAAALADVLDGVRLSSLHETAPVGVPLPHPAYLNAAAAGWTDLPPRALLDRLLAIERDLGRSRPHAKAPRTIDLDLILYGDEVIAEPGLSVPHPRFRERAFVLTPLAEVAPDMRDPVTGLTVEALLARLGAAGA